MSDRKPWHRRDDLGESAKAYHAFTHFRDLPPRTRSLARAYTLCQTACPRLTRAHRADPPPTPPTPGTLPVPLLEATSVWKAWRRRFLWDVRAAEWDIDVETEARADAVVAIREMNQRHAAIAMHAQGKLIERIQTLNAKDLSPGQFMLWLDKATTIERRARGEATDVVRHESAAPADLSALSDTEIVELERLLHKAQPGAEAPDG